MGESINGLKRTNYCGNFNINDVDKEITVFGFVHRQ